MKEIASRNQELAEKLEDKRQVIKSTVAKGASDNELEMFMHLAKEYGLDPFQKEIFFWKKGGRVTTMTSRDGYLKIANQHPAYEGMDSNIIYPGDELEITKKDIKLKSDSVDNMSKKPVGAYAVVYRSDRKIPTKIRVPFQEYFKANSYKDNWKKYPSAMILKVAESMALKRAFSVSGLVSKEEIGLEEQQEQASDVPNFTEEQYIKEEREAVQKESEQSNELSERQQEVMEIIEDGDSTNDDVIKFLQGMEAKGVDELSDEDYQELLDELSDEDDMITGQQRKKIFAIINDLPNDREYYQKQFGIDSLSSDSCTEDRADEFIVYLNKQTTGVISADDDQGVENREELL